jgi:hypothetical protein
MNIKNNLLPFLLPLLLLLGTCAKDLRIQEPDENGVIDSILVIEDTIIVVDTVEVEELFVYMVDVLGLWELIYYHAINGALWDNVPEDITHLNLTPNTCYMNTTIGGNTIIVDGEWIFTIQNFDYEFMVLKRYTDDGWNQLYVFERIEE